MKASDFHDLKFSLVTTIIVLGLIVAVGLTAALH
ncbi:cytochrome bd-I oxidase subunit CydH [Shigella sonnei]|nr:YnhF family membrane protein [Shigella sonnei]